MGAGKDGHLTGSDQSEGEAGSREEDQACAWQSMSEQ